MENFGWKKSKKWIRGILTGMILFGIMLIFACSEKVAAKETARVVRVGIYDLPGFSGMQEGSPIGYNYEYLAALAEVTGWKYEFIQVENHEDGLKKLVDKKIDLMAPVQKTAKGLAKCIYSQYAFGKQYTALLTDSSRTDLNYEVYQEFDGMKVAVVEGSVYTDNFEKYMAEHDFQVEYVYCESTTEALERMHNREADAAVANLLKAQGRDKVLARFCESSFYYVTYPGNEALMAELDAAMYHLQTCRPNLLNDLMEIYFPIYDIQYISAEQRAFIESSDVIRVGYMQDNIPVSYTDEKTGEFKGITRDILDRIQELSGLKFEYVPLPQGNVDYQYLKENNIMITADVTYNRWNRRSPKMTVTVPYDYMNRIMIGKENLIFYRNGSMNLAMRYGSQTLEEVVASEYPNFVLKNYPTIEDAFNAVMDGDADVIMVNQYVADYWLDKPIYKPLSIIPAEGMDDDHCLAVLDFSEEGETSDYKTIKEILDVAISMLPDDEVNMIIFQNAHSHRYQYTWKDFVYENLIFISLIVLVVVVILVTQNMMVTARKKSYQELAEKERKLAIQQKRYELIIEKSEDIIFEIDLQTNGSSVSVIMRDRFGWALDDFKPSENPDELMKCWKVHKDDTEILKKAYLETRLESKSSECVVRLVKKDVGYVWCRVRRYPIVNAKGEIVKIIGNIVNIDQLTREAQSWKTQTRTDSMTGLLNKQTFMEEVAAYLRERKQTNFCMVFFDLDHFKQINDSMGHLMGDLAIKETAQKLQVSFANVDLVARFGGDEFCIFVKNIPVEKMRTKLDHMKEKLSTQYQKLNHTIDVTTSIGAAYYHGTANDVPAILEEADKALYEAKEAGRNRIVFKEFY